MRSRPLALVVLSLLAGAASGCYEPEPVYDSTWNHFSLRSQHLKHEGDSRFGHAVSQPLADPVADAPPTAPPEAPLVRKAPPPPLPPPPPPVVTAPPPAAPVNTNKCGYCGQATERGDKVCRYCGAPL